MSSTRSLLGGACAALLLLAACTEPPEGVETLPVVPLQQMSSAGDTLPEQTQLNELKGPLVVNLFASWCAPCRDEIPVIDDFYAEHGESVEVIGIAHKDPNRDGIRELLAETEPSYPLLDDSLGELDALPPFPNTRGLPFWAWVDADGVVAKVDFVEIESVDELEDLTEQYLDVTL